jgi:hypothetical protein
MRCRTAPLNDVQFCIVAPRILLEAVRATAAQNLQTMNAYARAALLAQLKRDGVKLEKVKQNEAR